MKKNNFKKAKTFGFSISLLCLISMMFYLSSCQQEELITVAENGIATELSAAKAETQISTAYIETQLNKLNIKADAIKPIGTFSKDGKKFQTAYVIERQKKPIVIVGADYRLPATIAVIPSENYRDAASIENTPGPNLYINAYKQAIQDPVYKANAKAGAEKERWTNNFVNLFMNEDKIEFAPKDDSKDSYKSGANYRALWTPTWGQSGVYNDWMDNNSNCPDGGEDSYPYSGPLMGCSVVAVSQLMRVIGYNNKYNADWYNMPGKLTNSSSWSQKQAVWNLMEDVYGLACCSYVDVLRMVGAFARRQ